jgi:hypothetical protein
LLLNDFGEEWTSVGGFFSAWRRSVNIIRRFGGAAARQVRKNDGGRRLIPVGCLVKSKTPTRLGLGWFHDNCEVPLADLTVAIIFNTTADVWAGKRNGPFDKDRRRGARAIEVIVTRRIHKIVIVGNTGGRQRKKRGIGL